MKEELPKSMKLTASKKKAFWMFIGCSVFVIIGLFMIQEKDFGTRLMGWIGIIFFGLGVLIGGAGLFISSSSYLLLDDKGFTMCTLFRKHFYGWDEIEVFGIGNIYGNDMVMFDFSEKYNKAKTARKMNRFVSGSDAAIPNNYGIEIGELLELLTAFKNRFDYEQGNLPTL